MEMMYVTSHVKHFKIFPIYKNKTEVTSCYKKDNPYSNLNSIF